MKKVISVINGDGIGPEVVNEGIKVMKILSDYSEFEFEFIDAPAGGLAYKQYGTALPDSSYEQVKNSDAALFGGIGDPDLPPGLAERATFKIRQGLDMYVNLRPIKLYDVLRDRCPLKEEYIGDGIDITFVRENVEGLYSGLDMNFKDEIAQSIMISTRSVTERIIRYSYERALKFGHKTLTSVDKANVIEASRFWRNIFHEISEDYPNIKIEDYYMDVFSLLLIKEPSRFETVVTDNLYGDIVTDQGAILVGGLGIAPSGNINPSHVSMYEPVHGSAPDIAGKGIANPVATILSVKMMMEESFNSPKLGQEIENAVLESLKEGRTVDIKNTGIKTLSTSEMGSLIADKLKIMLKK